MPIPVRETFPTDRSDLRVQKTDDGSLTLIQVASGDGFHSGCGAASESRHVYLENSGIAERIHNGEDSVVLEVGLGTAMAMLMTVDLAVSKHVGLLYVALDIDWLHPTTLQSLRPHEWGVSGDLVDQYLQFRADHLSSSQSKFSWQVTDSVEVRIIIEDFKEWNTENTLPLDAIYYDPFCPENAPDLWTTECFRKLRPLMCDDGTLTTYSCSRSVRDRLTECEFACERVPGPPGGKREVLIAHATSKA
ncbi:MAG: tRNA (5-methylaminomethyl-2-thiouridine)(34)-methyltransferase MnmD [Planctomycetota bacterium]